jgi:hypothetical protein
VSSARARRRELREKAISTPTVDESEEGVWARMKSSIAVEVLAELREFLFGRKTGKEFLLKCTHIKKRVVEEESTLLDNQNQKGGGE